MKAKALPLLLLLATPAAAQTIAPTEAQSRAAAFLSARAKALSARQGIKAKATNATQLTLAYTGKGAQTGTCYYVFNRPNNQGYIIMGADKAAHEVLGYTDRGTFDATRLSDNLKWWLAQYETQISTARRMAAQHKTVLESTAHATATRTDVPAMCQTKWRQSAPFNVAITGGENSYQAGCVAIAGAQVMKYWRYPAQGNDGAFAEVKLDDEVTARATNTSMAIDWDNMKDEYATEYYLYKTYFDYTKPTNSSVADLVYNVGRASQMSYSKGGSATTSRALGAALIKYYNYDAGMTYESRNLYTDQVWEQMVYNELAAGRPLVYSGNSTAEGGHCFVCDGYDATNDLYHINWGWGNNDDGYFKLTGFNALNYVKDSEDANAFTGDQNILRGLQPNAGGRMSYSLLMSNTTLNATSAKAGTTVTLSGQAVNTTLSDDVDITPGVLLVSNTGHRIYIDTPTYTTPVGGNLTGYSMLTLMFSLPAEAKVGETYSVIPAFYDENGLLKEAASSTDFPQLTITAPESGVYLDGAPTFKQSSNSTTLNDFELSFNIMNATSTDLSTALTVYFMSKSNYLVASCDVPQTTYAAGQSTPVCITPDMIPNFAKLAEGEVYSIEIHRDDDFKNALLKSRTQYFSVVAPTNISYSLSAAQWGTICLPFSATVPTGVKAYTVSGHEGSTLLLTEVTNGTLSANTPYLLNGPAGDYPFSGPQATSGNYANGMLVGSTAANFSAPAQSYILANYNGTLGFYRIAASKSCRQYSAYLRAPQGTAFASLSIAGANGTVTAITAPTTLGAKAPGSVYDLNGRRTNDNAKGLVIVNGQKQIR